jgi:hypothetical protein
MCRLEKATHDLLDIALCPTALQDPISEGYGDAHCFVLGASSGERGYNLAYAGEWREAGDQCP